MSKMNSNKGFDEFAKRLETDEKFRRKINKHFKKSLQSKEFQKFLDFIDDMEYNSNKDPYRDVFIRKRA